MKNHPTAKLILRMAFENADLSMRYFDSYTKETDDLELQSALWANCMEHDGKAAAYLDCYEMLTGRRVNNIKQAIKEEYETVFMGTLV